MLLVFSVHLTSGLQPAGTAGADIDPSVLFVVSVAPFLESVVSRPPLSDSSLRFLPPLPPSEVAEATALTLPPQVMQKVRLCSRL